MDVESWKLICNWMSDSDHQTRVHYNSHISISPQMTYSDRWASFQVVLTWESSLVCSPGHLLNSLWTFKVHTFPNRVNQSKTMLISRENKETESKKQQSQDNSLFQPGHMCTLRIGEMSQDIDVTPATMVTFYNWVVDSRVLCPGAWNIYLPRQMSRMKEKIKGLFYFI